MEMLKVGTFAIRGSMKTGYFIVDLDNFNNWGVRRNSEDENFKTRQEAADYAKRCHEFKIGHRSSV